MTRKSPRLAAFTLLEMLVAVAVLALMVVVLAQLSGLTSQSVSDGLRRVDNYGKARAALDLIAQDVAGGVFRPDLAAFRDGTGARASAFFTRRVGIGGDRALSLVSYEWDAANLRLRRGSRAVLWSQASGVSFGLTNSLPGTTSLTPSDYQSIADGILRLEFYFLDADGVAQTGFDDSTAAVGVAIATLDSQAMTQLRASGRLEDLRTLLAPPWPPPAEGLVPLWESRILAPSFSQDYPDKVRRGLKFFERLLPVTR